MKKKVLSIILALALCLSLSPAAVAAEGHTCAEGEREDHLCDACGEPLNDLCTDADIDGWCDVCGCRMTNFIWVGGMALLDGDYLSNDGTISGTAPEGGWAHFADGVLTLNAYEYAGPGVELTDDSGTSYALVYSENTLDIRVESPSALVSTVEESDGIVVVKDLTFTGDTLAVTAYGDGVYSTYGTITLTDASLYLITTGAGMDSYGDVIVTGSDLGMLCSEDGLYVYKGDLTLVDSSLIITAAVDGVYLHDGGMKVSGSELLVNGGDGALFAYTYLELDEEMAVTLPEGGTVAEQTATTKDGEEYTYYTVVDAAGETALSVMAGKPCPSAQYTDVKADAWYHDAVDYVLANDLMESAGEGVFAPKANADRAGFIHALWKMAGSPVVNYLMMYEDVDQDASYAEAVRWASAMGIAKGYPDGTFRPGEAISRQEMAAFLYRYEQHRGGGFTGAWMFLLDCTDRADVAEWAYESMCWLTMKGLMNGDGTGALNPKATATRAEMAQLIMNYLEQE